jgi:hypothetical protein
MRGLDPRIHLFRKMGVIHWMDCRVEPGNDDIGAPLNRYTETRIS